MSRDAEDLLKAILALPEEDRSELLLRVFESLQPADGTHEAQRTESSSRLAAFERGDLSAIDHEDALRQIAK